MSAVDPTCIYVGGEITAAWNLISEAVQQALKERILGQGVRADLIPPRLPDRLSEAPWCRRPDHRAGVRRAAGRITSRHVALSADLQDVPLSRGRRMLGRHLDDGRSAPAGPRRHGGGGRYRRSAGSSLGTSRWMIRSATM